MLPGALAEGSLEIAITRDQPRVTASTSVSLAGLGAQDFEVQTSLEAGDRHPAEGDLRVPQGVWTGAGHPREPALQPEAVRDVPRRGHPGHARRERRARRLLRKGAPEGADLPDGVRATGATRTGRALDPLLS